MPDDGSKEVATWPMPKFRFSVDLGTNFKDIAFQEVSGMDSENQVIEYRKSNSNFFSTEKMPGITNYGKVTLKRGIFVNDNLFWKWHNEIAMNTIKRQTMLVKLLDEDGKITVQWQLNNAWPTKIVSTNLASDASEIAVDTLEIAHEQLIITHGS